MDVAKFRYISMANFFLAEIAGVATLAMEAMFLSVGWVRP